MAIYPLIFGEFLILKILMTSMDSILSRGERGFGFKLLLALV